MSNRKKLGGLLMLVLLLGVVVVGAVIDVTDDAEAPSAASAPSADAEVPSAPIVHPAVAAWPWLGQLPVDTTAAQPLATFVQADGSGVVGIVGADWSSPPGSDK